MRLNLFVVFVILPLMPVNAQESLKRYSPDDIVVTRWVDPTGSEPLTAAEWLREHPPSPMDATVVWSSTGREGELLFIVSLHIWESLGGVLNEYLNQLTDEGTDVTATVIDGGTPTSLKELIAAQSPRPANVFMVGNLPVAWFQVLSDWGYEEFPVDLFFMDLDGSWQDHYSHHVIAGRDTLLPGADGIFDTHTGLVAPEVPVGRLEASTILWGQEAGLIENYFEKNLTYRRGGLRLPLQGLSYVDDDWSDWTTVGLDSVYGQVVVVNDPEVTRASDYEEQLLNGFEWIGVMVHSWPGGHSFKYNNGQSWDSFYAWDLYYEMDAKANFYNLFACSNARYTDANYMAGIYVMEGSWGLGALGSTKTGSMLYFENFYEPLGKGYSMGESYLRWFQDMARDGFELWELLWYYGMTLVGDPTLQPALPADTEAPSAITDLEMSVSPDSASLSWSSAVDNLWVDHYVVYRFEKAYHSADQVDSVAVVTVPGYTDPMPAGNFPPVYYVVRACDGAGNLADDSNRVGLHAFPADIQRTQEMRCFQTSFPRLSLSR